MKLKMNTTLATPTTSYTQGEEYDFPDDEAKRLIEGGIAIDPSGKILRTHQATKPATRQTLDRPTGTPLEKLPSSVETPGHEFRDPAGTTLTTDRLNLSGGAPMSTAGVVATNAPTAEETKAANERTAPLSENVPDGKTPGGVPADKPADKKR